MGCSEPSGVTSRSASTRGSCVCKACMHVADLAEEQVSAMGLSDLAARALGTGAGEGVFAIAEELALDQSLESPRSSQPRRAGPTYAGLVRGLGKCLLARTRFAVRHNGQTLFRHTQCLPGIGLHLWVQPGP